MSNEMKPSGSLIYRFIKRLFDVVVSTILMIPIGLVILISGVAIKAEDKGPIFYMADRTGRFGKIFKMYKLRSMKVNAPDMTFIGPRPDTPVGSAAYTEEEKIILTVRPGITGYNQAVNRNSVLTKEKLKNDIYYVKHLSLWFDIKIVFMTIATVLGHKNINRADVSTENAYVLEKDGTKSSTEINK